jgi:hypothetical protein
MSMSGEMITAIVGFVGAFLIREVWDYIKGQKEKTKNNIDNSIEKNTEAISTLSISIVELKLRIDHLADKLQPVPKMAQDINEAHNKIREINNRVELIQGAIK